MRLTFSSVVEIRRHAAKLLQRKPELNMAVSSDWHAVHSVNSAMKCIAFNRIT